MTELLSQLDTYAARGDEGFQELAGRLVDLQVSAHQVTCP